MTKSEKDSEKDSKDNDKDEPNTPDKTPKEKRRRDILYGKGEYRILGKKGEGTFSEEDLLKLADFGSCRSIYSKQPYTEYISTRWYRAPECLLTDGYYTLHPLFPGSNEVDQIAKIHDIMGTPEPNVLNKFKKSRGMNFNFPSKKGTGVERLLPNASADALDLIYKLCTYDPDERMTAKQAIRHPYFKELRETDKRQTALNKAKIQVQDKDDAASRVENISPSPRHAMSDKENKKKESEIQIIASLPKPQSLPAHQLFKDKRKRRRRLGENPNGYSSSFFPKVPIHASTINPSYHSSSFPSTFSSHNTSGQLSLLPSINSTYKSHKNPSTKTKNMFNHYQLPSLDRRGAGF
ncbi:MOK-like protein [Mya arenaria]|uniref:MOK-like protein n=1 Tax=Mya arenaria TaxID=6604 RepID=A0ABY7FH10_MYAAR|nr:MOK-like protein [Mya arenaria]